MLTPLSITGGLVVDSGEELKLVQGHLLGLDAQLVIQLPLRSTLYTQNGRIKLRTGLTGDSKRVRAAGVGPHVGEGDLLAGALLQKEALVGVEQKNGEGTVQETLFNVGHQVAWRERLY